MTDSELQDYVIKRDEDTAKKDSDRGGLYPFGIIYQPSIEEIEMQR